MNIKIKRDKEFINYEVPKGLTLLQSLYEIKANIDNSLGFKSGCRSGICGVCAVRVNDKEELACSYKVKNGDEVTPLRYHNVIKDLIVDKSKSKETLKNASAWLNRYIKTDITIEEEKLTELQSDCILCSSCYSACPVFEVNKDFLGPFALTRVYRYAVDKREGEIKSTIDTIQSNGVWDCTLCGECTAVCPQGIDPKMDITNLRGVSSQFGYSDPNFVAMSFGF
ncbi:Succinate dehydrogenase iron-sulfur protein [hydrothermal vent metagenome]|uniref:succinate dehydrogenase n=1 Tax=hydrothermal vent metagenome TaxID=652676 RepID=A0A1W1BCW6_9ZZZZ